MRARPVGAFRWTGHDEDLRATQGLVRQDAVLAKLALARRGNAFQPAVGERNRRRISDGDLDSPCRVSRICLEFDAYYH